MKLKNIELNDFYVGYELEGCVKSTEDNFCIFDDFAKKIKEIHPKIDVGDDGSIESNPNRFYDEAFEIRTPPLKSKESVEVLRKICDLIEQYGYTNKSTGLHANFSPVSNKVYKEINPDYINKHPLFKKIAKFFRRGRNIYCSFYKFKIDKKKLKKLLIEDSSFKKIFKTKYEIWRKGFNDSYYEGDDKYRYMQMPKNLCDFDEHYCAVNFQNFTPKRTKTSRIEIRVMGNKDYHKKVNDIIKFTDNIIEVIKQSTKKELI